MFSSGNNIFLLTHVKGLRSAKSRDSFSSGSGSDFGELKLYSFEAYMQTRLVYSQRGFSSCGVCASVAQSLSKAKSRAVPRTEELNLIGGKDLLCSLSIQLIDRFVQGVPLIIFLELN